MAFSKFGGATAEEDDEANVIGREEDNYCRH
jgi:hypothetical protein